jgi:hypothetical protein
MIALGDACACTFKQRRHALGATARKTMQISFSISFMTVLYMSASSVGNKCAGIQRLVTLHEGLLCRNIGGVDRHPEAQLRQCASGLLQLAAA